MYEYGEAEEAEDMGARCWYTGCEWTGRVEGLVQTWKRAQVKVCQQRNRGIQTIAVLMLVLSLLHPCERVGSQPAIAPLACVEKFAAANLHCKNGARLAYWSG